MSEQEKQHEHPGVHLIVELPFALSTTAFSAEVEVDLPSMCDHATETAASVVVNCHNLGDVSTDLGGEGLQKFFADLGMERLAGDVEEKRQGRRGDRTLVKFRTTACRLEGEEDEPSDEAAWLSRCLWAMNRLLHPYLIATEDERVYFLSREHITAPVVLSSVPFGDPQFEDSARVFQPPGREYRFEPRGLDESFARRLENATTMEPLDHPIDSARLWLVHARRWRYAGEGDQAIVALQTSAERMLYGALQFVLADEGLSREELRQRLEDTSFKALVATEMPKYLGGNWSLSGKGAVAVYWGRLYLARNAITHAGYRLHRTHIDDAFDAYDGLEVHLHNRAVAKKNAYPRLAFGLLGAEGLRQRGQLTAPMKAWAQEQNEKGLRAFWLPPEDG